MKRVDAYLRPLQGRERVPKRPSVDLPRELIKGHEGGVLSIAHGPFGFAKTRVIEHRNERPPCETESRSWIIYERAKLGIERQVKEVAVLSICNGFFSSLEEGVEPMVIAVMKRESPYILGGV